MYYDQNKQDYKEERLAGLVGDLADANTVLVNDLEAQAIIQKDVASSRKRVEEIENEIKELN